MACQLVALTIDVADPSVEARFWSGVLGWMLAATTEPVALVPPDGTGFALHFRPSVEPRTGPNQYHFDLTSTSLDNQQETVERALRLGGRHLDVGQRPEETHVVLADPEGNEFCVIEPDNTFLAGCGLIGALSGDGSQRTGYFWSAALDWPLVWDQDEETAIQAPTGGTKLTWGGPPLEPQRGKERVHLDLAPAAGSHQAAEVERLIALGATRVDIGQGDVSWVVLADPDGHEFCVLSST